ncbi:AAA+-type ATPase [Agyrium rufum]|nr:AAA+-type ATPase [Agyrium rufum]
MTEPGRSYIVRPFSRPNKGALNDILRVYLSLSSLLLHKLKVGDICHLSRGDEAQFTAIAWNAPEKIQDNIIQVSRQLQDLHGLKFGEKLSVSRASLETVIVEAQLVRICQAEAVGDRSEASKEIAAEDREPWSWVTKHSLSRASYMVPGLLLDGVEAIGQKKSFRIQDINSSTSTNRIYQFSEKTRVTLEGSASNDNIGSTKLVPLSEERIGGLVGQIHQLNERIKQYSDSISQMTYPSYHRPRRGGVILHGSSGTGKTTLLEEAAKCQWKAVFRVDRNALLRREDRSNQSLSKIFDEATSNQPSLILIDRLEALAGRVGRSEHRDDTEIARTLCEEMDRIAGARVFVLAATTSLGEIDESLRRPGRFRVEIEIPVPDARARTEILKILHNLPSNVSNPDLEFIGERTHGYVGADLEEVTQLAIDKAESRLKASQDKSRKDLDQQNLVVTGTISITETPASPIKDDGTEIIVTRADLLQALESVRPTAMREVFLETPRIYWTDIGGNQHIKQALHQAIVWPLTEVARMERIGIKPEKALLLYGPPGCSKTLTAQAIATESNLNFLAVKGAELLSMYVGESERAVREIFRKARSASPSILFFDEIDAIGGGRAGGTNAAKAQGSLNVLTTLLNELDGIEELKGVFVLAATNAPESLDVALMRPGRFDTKIYVGPPDLRGREEILKIRLRKMDIDDAVDIVDLAEQINGYSGAEIVSVCQKAGYQAMHESISTSVPDLKVCKRHFDVAITLVPKGITEQMIERYERFASQ